MHLIRQASGRTLEDIGGWLLSIYPWPLRDAAWFVLTGDTPEVVPLRVRRSEGDTYEIVFAPWISEKTVRRAYRSLYEGDNHPIRRKSLSAFRFVDEHTEAGQTPKWAELERRWNEQNPKDTYTDRSALRRAYVRVE